MLILTLLLALAPTLPPATAPASGAPTFAVVQSELVDWAVAMSEHAGGKASSFEDVAEAMARSFWYEGLGYDSPFTIHAEPGPMAKLARTCEKTYGARGVVRGTSQRFLACLAISSFEDALGDNPDEWSEAALEKLPPPFRKHRAKLGKLARNHWLVISHRDDAAAHVEHWNLFIVERGDDRLIAGVLVGHARRGRA